MTSPPCFPAGAVQRDGPVQGLGGVHLTIGKTFTFEASHHLGGLPQGHKCGRDHGHSYQVEVQLAAEELVGPGFVTDFGELARFRGYLEEHFDHRCLNDVVGFEPTSELLAVHFAEWLVMNVQPFIPGRLVAVTVCETPRTWARCAIGGAR